jgi:hypothetical protein
MEFEPDSHVREGGNCGPPMIRLSKTLGAVEGWGWLKGAWRGKMG